MRVKRVLIRTAKVTAATVAVLLLALLVRWILAPDFHPSARVELTADETADLRRLLAPALLERAELAKHVAPARFLLVGETHFKRETVAYFLGLLDDLGDQPIVLLLELPQAAQRPIDDYMASGDEKQFAAIWGELDALPYHEILRWAFAHRARVRKVVATDENKWRIFAMRAVLNDTRNETMATAMLDAARQYAPAKVVAYGGAMHMLLGGRYLYDVANRRPAGLRLLEHGVPRADVASISLSGDDLPIATAWPRPAAVELKGPLALLPHECFYEAPIYRAARIGELHTHFVYLGPLSPQPPWQPQAPRG